MKKRCFIFLILVLVFMFGCNYVPPGTMDPDKVSLTNLNFFTRSQDESFEPVVEESNCRDIDIGSSSVEFNGVLTAEDYCTFNGYATCEALSLDGGSPRACGYSLECNGVEPYCWVKRNDATKGYDTIRCCGSRGILDLDTGVSR